MSAEPVWCLFLIEPDKSAIVKQNFEGFVEKNIVENLQRYSQRRERYLRVMKMKFAQLPVQSDETWLFLDVTSDLFFPQGVEDLLTDLIFRQVITQESIIEFVVTHRIGITQILYGGLGLHRASKLPGYFGNMLVEPEETAKTLGTVEALCAEISVEEFIERASSIGASERDYSGGLGNLLSLLPSALRTALLKGYGLLTLNFPHLGTMPFPEN